MVAVNFPSRARSVDKLSSSRFIRRAFGQCSAKEASIGAIECFKAWIRAMRIYRFVSARGEPLGCAAQPLLFERNHGHQGCLCLAKWTLSVRWTLGAATMRRVMP